MEQVKSGTIVGSKYRITELLGVGGMAQVYHARHITIPEFEVSIKVLDPAFTSSIETRDRFRNEVIAGYRANHPNVVRMYEYFDLGEMQAFAMEYVSGGTLLELMEDGLVDISVSLSIIKQIALGLSSLHRAGTLHRDIKPANILLTEDGVAKITDFGVARVRGGGAFTDSELLVGTPKYVPPEYVEQNEVDHRGDLFSLGVIGYELLSGATPFRALTEISLLKERLEQRGADLSEVVSSIPPDISSIIARAMAVKVSDRYPHATALVEDITAVQKKYSLPESYPECLALTDTRIVWQTLLESPEQGVSEKNEEEYATS